MNLFSRKTRKIREDNKSLLSQTISKSGSSPNRVDEYFHRACKHPAKRHTCGGGYPVVLPYLKSLDPGSKACRDDRYMDSIYLALKRLSVIVK